ncbi:MAG TPA: ABC transporter substrate-binding protein [Clostridia bacterium]|nr:ABC transporter substrate-binding protein [Clostridia bacterium]
MKKLLALALAALLLLSILPAALAEDGHYPVTVTMYNYAKEPIEITFEKAPEKVLCVYQNSIETMLALGLEDHILACAGLDHAVKPEWQEAFDKVNYLTEFAPDKETVVMMEPDFIVSWYSFFGEKKLGEVDYWLERGINTYIYANTGAVKPRTLENEYNDLLNMGKIFNVEDRAEALVGEIRDEVARIEAYTQTAEKAPVVLIVEFLGENINVYGAEQLGGDMVTQLGGVHAMPEGTLVFPAEPIIRGGGFHPPESGRHLLRVHGP